MMRQTTIQNIGCNGETNSAAKEAELNYCTSGNRYIESTLVNRRLICKLNMIEATRTEVSVLNYVGYG